MDETNERISIPPSSDAHAAWAQSYDTKLATLQRGDVEPFTPGRYLGKGGVGAVHETSIGGHVVALKRIWIRGAPKDHHKAEFEILQKMSTKRHRHVVEAIGMYILPGRPNTELGVLIWPVAQYDLDRLLYHFQILSQRQKQQSLELSRAQLTEARAMLSTSCRFSRNDQGETKPRTGRQTELFRLTRCSGKQVYA
jgi:hypothetical protein